MHIVALVLALLLYPATAVLWFFSPSFGWMFAKSVSWRIAPIVGVVALVVLMALLPDNLSLFDFGPRVARPLTAYLGGLAATALVVFIGKLAARNP